jgi:hypothetical protein
MESSEKPSLSLVHSQEKPKPLAQIGRAETIKRQLDAVEALRARVADGQFAAILVGGEPFDQGEPTFYAYSVAPTKWRELVYLASRLFGVIQKGDVGSSTEVA